MSGDHGWPAARWRRWRWWHGARLAAKHGPTFVLYHLVPLLPGIQLQGHASFNTRLLSRLSLAPADLMHFLEACAMGNITRVEELLNR